MDCQKRYVLTLKSLLHIQDMSGPQYTLLHDPLLWETNLSPNILEDDDYIHDPRDVDSANMFRSILSVSRRGLMNMGCLILLIIGILALL